MRRSRRCARTVALVVAMCAVDAAPVAAQWSVEAQAGRLQYDAAPGAVTTSLAAALTHSTFSSSFGLSAGLPFTGEEPAWAALQGYKRFASSGAVRFGIDLAANGFGYHLSAPDTARLLPLADDGTSSITGWGAAAEVMPLVAFRSGPLNGELRAGMVGFLSDGSEVEAVDRTAFVADASLFTPAWHGLSARVDGRWVSVTEGAFPFAGVAVAWTGPATIRASIGRWFDDAVQSVSWSAGATLPLGERVALMLNARHEEIEPVYATPARTTWGAGVRIMLGDSRLSVTEPIPDEYADGIATIRLDDEDGTGTPSIAGDFNEWTPAPMTRDADADGWVFRTALAPGVYHYAFVDAGGNWFVPEDTPGRRSDGMGGYVAVLIVEER